MDPQGENGRRERGASLDAFRSWFESEYPRLAEKATHLVPDAPATGRDDAARRLIAQACLQYEMAFVPAQFSHDARLRKNEILALLVLKLARVHGHAFASRDDAAETVTRLVGQSLDEDKVKTALGGAGAFLAPLLSPDLGRRAWRIFKRVPFWAKAVIAGGVVTAVVAAPMVTPLTLGVVAREEFAARGAPAPREVVLGEE